MYPSPTVTATAVEKAKKRKKKQHFLFDQNLNIFIISSYDKLKMHKRNVVPVLNYRTFPCTLTGITKTYLQQKSQQREANSVQ